MQKTDNKPYETPAHLKAFCKSLRVSYQNSRNAQKAAEKVNVLTSPHLTPFSPSVKVNYKAKK